MIARRPYRSTPVFDEETLPAALRASHSTKAGTWGLIRVIEGELRLTFPETGRILLLAPGKPGQVNPGEIHFVTPLGPMKMQVDFHSLPPLPA